MLGNLLPGAEKRAISYQTLFASGDSILFSTNSGVVIDQENVLKVNAVYACVRIIADSISTLPVDSFQRVNGTRRPYRPKPEWLDMPDIGVTFSDLTQLAIASMLLNGNAFIRVLRDERGIAGLIVLNPLKVQVSRTSDGARPLYIYDNRDTITHDEMLHIKELVLPGQLRGKSRVDLVKENLGLASALEQFAARFFSGSNSSGIIEYPGNLTKEQALDLANAFENEHKGLRKSHRTGVLFGGAKFQRTTPDNNTAQFIESRKFAVEEIARAFRVPPSMLGVIEPGAASYNSLEQNSINFVVHTLRPYIYKLEQAFTRLLPQGVFVKYNVDGLMRGDSAARSAYYQTMLAAGAFSINDVRTLEDMAPVDGGDTVRVPLHSMDLDAANLADLDKKTMIAQRLIQSGFDPQAVLAELGLPAIAHTGVPTVMLQPISQIDAEDPLSAYQVGA